MRLIAVIVVAGLLAACSKQEPATAALASTPPPSAPAASRTLASTAGPSPDRVDSTQAGEKLFQQNCATCHMADGSGVPFLQPPIKGSAWISSPDPQLLLSLILRGSAVLGEAAQAFENDMAPQDHLTDAEIAALTTFVRGKFASPPAGPVTAAEVALARSRPGLP